MEFVLDRRTLGGRRHSDRQGGLATRELLHDVVHDLATLACLIEAVWADPALSEATRHRVSLMRRQTLHTLEFVGNPADQAPRPQAVAVRALVSEIVSLSTATRETTVVVSPGDERWLRVEPSALWRVLANVIDNAARAAGSGGRVEVSIGGTTPDVTVVEVVDDGPGFGDGPRGIASLGLSIVAALARTCGGTLHLYEKGAEGTRVRLEFRDRFDESVEREGSQTQEGRRW